LESAEAKEQEIIMLDIKASKVVTISAKVSPLEMQAIEEVARLCGVSRSYLLRTAFLRLVSEIYALSPELLNNVPREVLKEAESAKEMTFKCIKGP
jgi:hypothetical protein